MTKTKKQLSQELETLRRRVAELEKPVVEGKKAEEALRKSEGSLAEAQRIAHIGSWDLDLVSNTLTWSDEVYRMFGLETTKRIRASEADREIPIVALTSYAMVGDRESALAAGCTGYIEKPINPEIFMADIEKYL